MYKDRGFVYTSRLKAQRAFYGFSLADMARMLGKNSASTYKYIEDGKTEPKISTMNAIADILNQPVHYFFRLNVSRKK